MNSPRIEILNEQERPELVRMLEDSGDLDLRTVDLYRIGRAMSDVTLVAWVDGSVVGMLNASYNADFRGMPPFELFDLPRRPHAFLDRIHVHPAGRRARIGRELVDAFVLKAEEHACTFAGGHIDATSDPTVRIEFFEGLGFEIRGNPAALTAGLVL
jgi:GNAT superfamily N-acetyltransferase